MLLIAALSLLFTSCFAADDGSHESEDEGGIENKDPENSDGEYPESDFKGTAGLVYRSNGDGTCALVSPGLCNESEIVVPKREPNGELVVEVGEVAFAGLMNTSCIVLPASVAEIAPGAFGGCTSLTEIIIDGESDVYKTIDGNLYTKDGTELVQYAIGKSSKSFVIPSGVTKIGEYAFYNCDNLTDIHYMGTEDEWNLVIKEEAWCDLSKCTATFEQNIE